MRVAIIVLALAALAYGYLTTRARGTDHEAMPGVGQAVTPTSPSTTDGGPPATPVVNVAETPPAAGVGQAMPGTDEAGEAGENDAVAPSSAPDVPGESTSGTSALGTGPTGIVVGTGRLEIRSCPAPSCGVVVAAPLGASVQLPVGVEGIEPAGVDDRNGQAGSLAATGRFIPVEYQGKAGYAPDLFVATEPGHAPYLLRGEEGCKRIALIFNVGVGQEPATGILDTLKAERVPATMFVMGWWADEHPAILERMVAEGYLIGSHGYDDIELTERPDDEVAHDVRDTTSAIAHATGKPPAPYFTPYAAAIDERTRAVVAAAGYLPVAWTVSAQDYGPDATEDVVYRNVMDGIHDGAIVELHLDAPASAESTGRALPRIIKDLRAEGYRFVTIPEMAQPCR